MGTLDSFKQARALLHAVGIHHQAATMVLYAMIDDGISYQSALQEWALYENGGAFDSDRWNSQICYQALAAGIDEHPAELLTRLARRARNED